MKTDTKQLDFVLDLYVKELSKKSQGRWAKDSIDLAVKQLRQDIVEEIVEVKKKEYKQQVEEELSAERNTERIKELKSLFINSVILAFFIGMIVNQSTNIISRLEDYVTSHLNSGVIFNVVNNKFIVPSVIILIFLIVIIVVWSKEYINTIIKLVNYIRKKSV